MSWPFCPQCGTILDDPVTDTIKCTFCPFACKFADLQVPETITRSAPGQRPAWAEGDSDGEEDANGQQKNKVETNENKKVQHATIEEPCPNCHHHELLFYTMQLRSADEGSTVFYECSKCNHKFSQNN